MSRAVYENFMFANYVDDNVLQYPILIQANWPN